MASQLVKGLARYDDLKLSAIVLNQGRLAEEIRRLGMPVEVLDERTLSFLQIMKAAKKIIGTTQPDILHSHRYKENLLSYLIIKRERLHATAQHAARYAGSIWQWQGSQEQVDFKSELSDAFKMFPRYRDGFKRYSVIIPEKLRVTRRLRYRHPYWN
jgi:hypothetical protein